MKRSAAVFLDRDGVINHNVYYADTGEWESPRSAEDLVLIEGSLTALKALQAKGFLLFLISNQPSFAKGKASLESLQGVQRALQEIFDRENIFFTATYYCYHHPEGVVEGYRGACECRKPSPFFIRQAAQDYPLDLAVSYMIGDRDSDLECAARAKVRPIGIRPDHPPTLKHRLTQLSPYPSLLRAIDAI